MQISFFGPENLLTPEFTGFVAALCNHAVADMNVPAERIRFHFVSDEKYGPTIKEIDPAASHSENSLFTGVAKHICTRDERGEVSCSIVVRLGLMEHLWLDVEVPERELAQWSAQSHVIASILHHELGHFADEIARSRSAVPTPSEEEIAHRFDSALMARYYAPIVESELAACVLGAAAVTAQAHAEETRSFVSSLQEARERAWRERIEHSATGRRWDQMAVQIASCFWMILVQFSKLVGTRIGNPALGEGDLVLDRFPEDEQVLPVLEEFGTRLEEHWKTYPAWNEPVPAFMREAWEKLVKTDTHDEELFADERAVAALAQRS